VPGGTFGSLGNTSVSSGNRFRGSDVLLELVGEDTA
jgi:hypothetical protein